MLTKKNQIWIWTSFRVGSGTGSGAHHFESATIFCSFPHTWHSVPVRIRILGSVHFTNGSGSGSCSYREWPSRCQSFILILFKRYIYIILQRQKFIKSHKTVKIKVLLHFLLADWRIRIRIRTNKLRIRIRNTAVFWLCLPGPRSWGSRCTLVPSTWWVSSPGSRQPSGTDTKQKPFHVTFPVISRKFIIRKKNGS